MSTSKLQPVVLGIVLTLCLAACAPAVTPSTANTDVLYQVSTLGALQQGLFGGSETIAVLKQHGDFGLGTFDALNGEMIVLDGKVYQVTVDGVGHVAADTDTTPFAVVTFFETDATLTLNQSVDLVGLGTFIDGIIPTENVFYAIKLAGTFEYLKTRSEAKQMQPYPLLTEALKNQTLYEFTNVRGTMVGFRTPAYAAGLNQAGYHFHFISEDGKTGGHVLEAKLANVPILLDETRQWETVLPRNAAFDDANLNPQK